MTVHMLREAGGTLDIGDEILLRVFDLGDCNTINWPFEGAHDPVNLEVALYDEVQTNPLLRDGDVVLLPDGVEFGRVVGFHFIRSEPPKLYQQDGGTFYESDRAGKLGRVLFVDRFGVKDCDVAAAQAAALEFEAAFPTYTRWKPR